MKKWAIARGRWHIRAGAYSSLTGRCGVTPPHMSRRTSIPSSTSHDRGACVYAADSELHIQKLELANVRRRVSSEPSPLHCFSFIRAKLSGAKGYGGINQQTGLRR